MQTFLPYPDFEQSARVLDRQRLGKQRVEAKQIILALENGGGWSNHPAVKMWAGYIPTLAEYGATICLEWIERGYKDSLLLFFLERLEIEPELPHWLGDEDFHASHRSNLLRKDEDWYSQFGWTEPENLAYVWPGGNRDGE